MSYNIDGKLANQTPFIKMSGKVNCAKCNKLIPAPRYSVLLKHIDGVKFEYIIRDYIGQEYFIYESKSGTAVVYCSEYCKKKHNHRFKK
jgi:hypothetical protein